MHNPTATAFVIEASEKDGAMQQWNYSILRMEMQEGQWQVLFQEGWTPLDEILPDMGRHGWELVSTTPIVDSNPFAFVGMNRHNTNRLLMIFKRPKASEAVE
jgi:hypothetical protein